MSVSILHLFNVCSCLCVFYVCSCLYVFYVCSCLCVYSMNRCLTNVEHIRVCVYSTFVKSVFMSLCILCVFMSVCNRCFNKHGTHSCLCVFYVCVNSTCVFYVCSCLWIFSVYSMDICIHICVYSISVCILHVLNICPCVVVRHVCVSYAFMLLCSNISVVDSRSCAGVLARLQFSMFWSKGHKSSGARGSVVVSFRVCLRLFWSIGNRQYQTVNICFCKIVSVCKGSVRVCLCLFVSVCVCLCLFVSVWVC